MANGSQQTKVLKGNPISSGIGVGKVVFLKEEHFVFDQGKVGDLKEEQRRFQQALSRAKYELEQLEADLIARVRSSEADIVRGHILILSDPILIAQVEETIAKKQCKSELAIEEVLHGYIDQLLKLEDDCFRQRATDLQDIKQQVQRCLCGKAWEDGLFLKEGSVLVAQRVFPSMIASLDASLIQGIVTFQGAEMSHTAILARALGIPFVTDVGQEMSEVSDQEDIIVDGFAGEVMLYPTLSQKNQYKESRQRFFHETGFLQQYRERPCITRDGTRIELLCNIGSVKELSPELEYQIDGIGLFRTEYLFMKSSTIPTEQEQFLVYKALLEKMGKKPVTIRLLDIGGDKEVSYLGLEKEINPFLGYRGIRLCLGEQKELLMIQLRALLRASIFGNLKIMIPMVSCMEEIWQVKAWIELVKKDLQKEGISFSIEIPLGVMIETPAAATICDLVATEVSFISIGTNDLIQYIMCVDRDNPKVSYLYSSFHPAVLRSLHWVIHCANHAGIEVSMCGEVASDPMMIPMLVGFGLRAFSTYPSFMLSVKHLLSKYEMKQFHEVGKKVLSLSNEAQIRAFMEEWMEK